MSCLSSLYGFFKVHWRGAMPLPGPLAATVPAHAGTLAANGCLVAWPAARPRHCPAKLYAVVSGGHLLSRIVPNAVPSAA